MAFHSGMFFSRTMRLLLVVFNFAVIYAGANVADITDIVEKLDKSMIKYADVERLAQSGRHFLVAFLRIGSDEPDPYLEHLSSLNKELALMNETLQIYLMNADDERNKQMDQQRIVVFPSFILFLGDTNGIVFSGQHTAHEILESYQRVLATTIQKIETAEDLTAFRQAAYATVLFKISNEVKETYNITLLARRLLDVKFGYVMEGSDIVTEAAYMIIYREGDKRETLQEKAHINEMESLIRIHTRQAIIRYPMDVRLLPSFDEIAYMYYVHNEEGLSQNKYWLEEVGNEQRGNIIVALYSVADLERDYAPLTPAWKGDSLPRVRVVVRPTSTIFRMEDYSNGDIGKESVTAFLKDIMSGKVKPFVASEELPEDWDASPLKTLVANNFLKVVHDKSMNVLVFFYAAEHTDSILLFERIADLYKDVKDFLVAKMNVQLNYIPSFIRPSRTLPTVRLYEAQTNNEISYGNDPLTEEEIVKFVEDTAGIVVKHEEKLNKEAATEDERTITGSHDYNHEEL